MTLKVVEHFDGIKGISMSVEPKTSSLGGPSISSQTLDLTGLPSHVADELRKLVSALRDNMGYASSPSTAAVEEPPEAWSQRLQAWVNTHPARPITIDDSRTSLYSGRGE
jgi:hypothetical protein